ERARSAAVVLAQCAHRLLGSLWPAQSASRPDSWLHAGVVVRPEARRQIAGAIEALMQRPAPWRLVGCGALLLLVALTAPTAASERKHGLSAFGDLGYPANFDHFNYADPNAPKGGTFSLVGWGGVATFNSLNNYILKGDAPH